MNTKGKPGPLVRAFIEFVYSPEGAEIVRASGYIPIPGPGTGLR
jgi:phosphate transport system substrate-binding protein